MQLNYCYSLNLNSCFILPILFSLLFTCFISPKPAACENEIIITKDADSFEKRNIPVRFYLYTSQSQVAVTELRVGDTSTLEKLKYDPEARTVIICHGFISNHASGPGKELKKAYFEAFKNINVVVVDWSDENGGAIFEKFSAEAKKSQTGIMSNLVDLTYFPACAYTRTVGNETSSLIKFLVTKGKTTPGRIHLVGHSLGAHAMGWAGMFYSNRSGGSKVDRITGLDPAGPCFEPLKMVLCGIVHKIFGTVEFRSLRPTDAEFVDVIHTNTGLFGNSQNLGHVDFYPNGGFSQLRTCYVIVLGDVCSHSRSITLFANTIRDGQVYKGLQCGSWVRYQLPWVCTRNPAAYMGEYVSRSANRGSYYLTT